MSRSPLLYRTNFLNPAQATKPIIMYDPFDDLLHYEFYRTDTGEVIAEKMFTARHIEQVMEDGSVIDHDPDPLWKKVVDFQTELANNLKIPYRLIKSRENGSY